MKREVKPYKNFYWNFYEEQTKKVQEKINYVLHIVMTLERVPEKFFKHLEDGIYEIRIERSSNIYRIFSFFDHDNLIILLHGFQKKSQKLPRKELNKAKILRTKYYEEKQAKNNK